MVQLPPHVPTQQLLARLLAAEDEYRRLAMEVAQVLSQHLRAGESLLISNTEEGPVLEVVDLEELDIEEPPQAVEPEEVEEEPLEEPEVLHEPQILTDGLTYHEVAAQLVLMAWLQRVVHDGGYVQREYGVGRGRIDLLMRWPLPDGEWQREALELKVWAEGREDPLAKGLVQLRTCP